MYPLRVSASLLALDVALLLPPPAFEVVAHLNDRLTAPPNGFVFDTTHLPHVTLAQQFVPAAEMAAVRDALHGILSTTPPLELRSTGLISVGTTTSLTLEPIPDLAALHQRLMDRLAPFDLTTGDAASFYDDTEPARTRDVEWVARFRTRAAYGAWEPHVTLGVGRLEARSPAIQFVAARVAACQLGRYCTCRRVIAAWTLTAPSG